MLCHRPRLPPRAPFILVPNWATRLQIPFLILCVPMLRISSSEITDYDDSSREGT